MYSINEACYVFELLSDSIISGFFIGKSGVAGINAVTPVTAVVTFFRKTIDTNKKLRIKTRDKS